MSKDKKKDEEGLGKLQDLNKKLLDENTELKAAVKDAGAAVDLLRTENQDLKATLDTFVGAPPEEDVEKVPMADVLKVVKRTKTVMVKKDDKEVAEERAYAIKPDEVLSFRSYPDRFIVVTTDGQKFSAARE